MSTPAVHDPDAELRGATWWTGVAVGWLAILWGVAGLLRDQPPAETGRWLLWFVGALLLHDAFVLPIALGLGLLIRRFVPRVARGALQAGLAASAIVTVIAFPVLTGYGRAAQPDNATLLTRDYATGLAQVLLVVWVVVVLAAVGLQVVRSPRGA